MNKLSLVAIATLALSAMGFAQTTTQTTTTTTKVVTTTTNAKPTVYVAKSNQQVKEQSIAVTTNSNGISLTYLRDGYQGMVGVTGQVTQLLPRLNLDALGVTPLVKTGTTSQAWVGGALQYDLLGKPLSGWSVNLLGGYKGWDVTQPFSAQTLQFQNFVFGFTVGRKF